MHFNFSDDINNFLRIILVSATEQNREVFFVGGLVRDRLLNIDSNDIDILVLGDAIDFVKHLPFDMKVKSVHKEFGTAKVLYNNLLIDFASTRSEHYPYSGCLPVVDKIGVSLEEDVKRRDFTVNSIYCKPFLSGDNLSFELIDFTGGMEDIQNKTLRVLHKKSYTDDPTRILRGVDFKHRFSFDFSSYDKKLINQYLSDVNREYMSFDRAFAVLKKVLSSKNNFEVLKTIIENKYYKILFPDDLFVDYSRLRNVIEKFQLNSKQITDFYLLILQNKSITPVVLKSPLNIYNFFSKFDLSYIAYYYYKTNTAEALLFNQYKDIKLLIKGDNLIDLGFKPGKIFSIIMDKLFDEKLNNPNRFLTMDDEINWVVENFK